MLIRNVIFRMGAAAILLSNRHKDKHKAKYKLQHLVPTHMGKAFEHFCIHAGGKAIIQAVEDNLRLQKEDGEASSDTIDLGTLRLYVGMNFATWRQRKDEEG
ncbi:hypothetical protein Ddye_001059 [Dipteronia dyeriana]|uniref:FAE domain-containing protein n=1 Tax=Dipteronia dyeriana TaxID=168575 RepID=A0AAE0CSY5_9ROSI|nr:hypothetical protein Ddye_001059 [Dipteronia dyeriana]